MADTNSKGMAALSGVVMAGIAILATISPALAQVPPGAHAAVYVGGPVANCPPAVPAALTPAGATVNGVTVSGAGRCTPLAADAEGSYSLAGFGPLTFTSQCANVGGVVQHGGGVEVPAGTSIAGGVPIAAPTVVTTENTPVVFPGGRAATLNVVTSTATSFTRDAIVFAGGPTVGRAVCGLTAYPLAVDSAGASEAAAALPELPSSGGDGGGVSTALLAAGALVLVVLGQLVLGRTLRGREGDATT